MMLFYAYILYSSVKDKFYIGHTEDVENRLLQHNTRNNLGTNDWTVVYTEKYDNRSDAMKREKEIKYKKSRKYIEWLINKKD